MYRACIATRTLCPDQQSQLIELAEQTGKFKDSLPPKLQIFEGLKNPAAISGLLAIVAFLQKVQVSSWLIVTLGCLLFAPFILACRLEYLALDWKIPVYTSGDSAAQPSLIASTYTLEAKIFQFLDCSGKSPTIYVDIILQLVAGIIATIGGIVFLIERLIQVPTSFNLIFWGLLDLMLFLLLVFNPARELKHRAERYANKVTRAAYKRKRGLAISRFIPQVILVLGFAVIFVLTYISVFQYMTSMLAFTHQHVGMTMPLSIPNTLGKSGLIVRPQSSNRNCQMATGDLVTILQDQSTIKVVSSPQSACPAQYQAAITGGIIEALGGPRIPIFTSAIPHAHTKDFEAVR